MEMDPAGTDPAIRGVRPLLLFPHAPVFESPCQARLLDRIPWPHEGASPSRLPSLVIHSSSGKKRVPPPPRSVPDLRPSTADSPIPCFSAQADSEAELPNRFPPGKPHIEVTDLNPDRSPPTPVLDSSSGTRTGRDFSIFSTGSVGTQGGWRCRRRNTLPRFSN